MPEFNLDSIKQEIEARRSEQMLTEQQTGTGRMGAPRESKKFLVDLLQSVNQGGAPTAAVQALRTVTEQSDAIYGVPTTIGRPSPSMPQTQYQPQPQQYNQQPYQQPQQLNENFMGGNTTGDRGADSYFEQQMQQGMELLRVRAQKNQQGQPQAGLGQALNEYNNAPMMPQQGFNPNMLNEHIANSANFQKLVEGAYKNMINEMFAKEKIENALVEIVQSETFKKIMKKTIVDTLLEIQNRNKKSV